MPGCLPSEYFLVCFMIMIMLEVLCQIQMINIGFICAVIIFLLALRYSPITYRIFIHRFISNNNIKCIILEFEDWNMFKLELMN